MKPFASRVIQDLEIFQLLILDVIYSQPFSRKLLFQGGTCLRWAYAGTRYSEDLDFLGRTLEDPEILGLKQALEKGLEKKIPVQFGPGSLEVTGGEKRKGSLHTTWIKYRREGERSKMAVKIEMQEAEWKEAERLTLRQIPEVNRFLREAAIRVPFGRSVILCAPAPEILAEKIKAMVERTYVKGRDLYDIWFLTRTLGVAAPPALVVERTQAYPGRFVSKRSLRFFLDPKQSKELLKGLDELRRFLPPEELEYFKELGYKEILSAVETTVKDLLEQGLHERIIG
ncbi:MAG: nucleotidyl transferase AbiEii/AbiGii toxin family protein [bacterium]